MIRGVTRLILMIVLITTKTLWLLVLRRGLLLLCVIMKNSGEPSQDSEIDFVWKIIRILSGYLGWFLVHYNNESTFFCPKKRTQRDMVAEYTESVYRSFGWPAQVEDFCAKKVSGFVSVVLIVRKMLWLLILWH